MNFYVTSTCSGACPVKLWKFLRWRFQHVHPLANLCFATHSKEILHLDLTGFFVSCALYPFFFFLIISTVHLRNKSMSSINSPSHSGRMLVRPLLCLHFLRLKLCFFSLCSIHNMLQPQISGRSQRTQDSYSHPQNAFHGDLLPNLPQD